MKNMGYELYTKEEITLRDQLAIDRTDLANSRTMLAYVKLALLSRISGYTILKLSGMTNRVMIIVIVLFVFGITISIYGAWKYIYYRNALEHISKSRHRKAMKERLFEK